MLLMIWGRGERGPKEEMGKREGKASWSIYKTFQ